MGSLPRRTRSRNASDAFSPRDTEPSTCERNIDVAMIDRTDCKPLACSSLAASSTEHSVASGGGWTKGAESAADGSMPSASATIDASCVPHTHDGTICSSAYRLTKPSAPSGSAAANSGLRTTCASTAPTAYTEATEAPRNARRSGWTSERIIERETRAHRWIAGWCAQARAAERAPPASAPARARECGNSSAGSQLT